MSETARVLLAVDGPVATLTIIRPEVLNALDRPALAELRAAVARAVDDGGVRCLVITGAGERAFVAGADVRALHDLGAEGALELMAFGQAVFDEIAACPKPVVARINGFALGGGLELAMACDLRIASDTARFGQPEITLGSLPGWGGTVRLPLLVGVGRARELILTGRLLDAAEAARIGLVHHVLPAAELDAATATLAAELAARPPIALRLAKESLRRAEGQVADGLRYERECVAQTFATADQREGTRAFLEKRAPVFRGR